MLEFPIIFHCHALSSFMHARACIIDNSARLVHYSESPTLVPLQILHNAQLTTNEVKTIIVSGFNQKIKQIHNALFRHNA